MGLFTLEHLVMDHSMLSTRMEQKNGDTEAMAQHWSGLPLLSQRMAPFILKPGVPICNFVHCMKMER